jgi:hypothetical protein
MLDAAERLGIPLERVVDAMLGEKDAIAEVNAAADAAIGSKTELEETSMALAGVVDQEAEAAGRLKDRLGESNSELEEAQRQTRQHAEAVGEGAGAEAELETAVAEANTVIAEQTSAVSDLISELEAMVSTVFAARDAERNYEQAIDDAKAALEENGATLDNNTEKGRRNQQALDGIAESALKDAAATLEDAEAKGDLAAGHDRATAKMETARAEFIKVARQMGLSKEAANALADELGLIPGNYEATVEADTANAMSKVQAFIDKVNSIPSQKFTTVGLKVAGGTILERQHGGPVPAGRVALLGERGPELARFGSAAHVFTAQQTKEILSGASVGTAAGGKPIVVNGPLIGELRAFSDTFPSLTQLYRQLELRGAF